MAHYNTQGRVKLLLSGEGASFGSESRDPFHYKVGSVRTHKRRFRFLRASSSSSNFNKSGNHGADLRVSVRNDGPFANDNGVNVLDAEDEFETDDLASFRGLVLDISYRPVNVVCWKRAICLEFMEKADVLEYYDQTVNSPSGSFYIPAVLRVHHLLQVIRRRRVRNTLSRKSILHRDGYICQYCSSNENLTIDHVVPLARGGEWKWENLVVACMKCNSKKGQKTPEEANMKLMKTPKMPKDYDILAIPLTTAAIRMLKLWKGTPEEWRQYLSKPSCGALTLSPMYIPPKLS